MGIKVKPFSAFFNLISQFIPLLLTFLLAAASYWLNGGRPRMSSMVRIMLTVAYCVLLPQTVSVACRI